MTAFDVAADSTSSNRRIIAEWGYGIYPDGLALNQDGDFRIAFFISNSAVRPDRNGPREAMMSDFDNARVQRAEAAWRADRMARMHLNKAPARTLRDISNLVFGGPDLRTGFLGWLLGCQIATFRNPVVSAEPSYWRVDLGTFSDYQNL